jgi:23S rRNA pseudouridine2604 synthase
LVQGLNRQIRRMCEYFEYEVTKLERVRIMNINLKGIPTGEWRPLQPHEMAEIMTAIANSSSTAEASTSKKQTNKPSENTKKPVQGQRPTSQRSTAAKQMDRSTNPNPKSKALRGTASGVNDKKYGVKGSSNFAKNRPTKR